jgi:acetoin utilization deacetylase AcuC-like enzyme
MHQKTLHIAWHPIYAHPLPEGHRFPMVKYELIPGQLLHEGSITPSQLFAPAPCPIDVVCRTHEYGYVQKLLQQSLSEREQRLIGFPQSPQLTQRELIIAQGTLDCCTHAYKNGVAMNVAGGTHHAFAERGEGFCLLNDMAIAANELLYRGVAKKIVIIDLDVHQGNGTAKLFEHTAAVYTFSMHGAHNYPFKKEKSNWDIELPNGIGDDEYLQLLKDALPVVLKTVQPDFAFYLSGVDILQTDKFGKLGISMQGCKTRDEMVFDCLHRNGVPCVVAMGGGYSADVKLIVEAHCNTFRVAKDVFGLL